ncbi:MAG: hypothetical protein GY821_07500 [Gammaproteobacteria bacterium]|nr:hypothetical protein [Gammaproteobacteria bacterium]
MKLKAAAKAGREFEKKLAVAKKSKKPKKSGKKGTKTGANKPKSESKIEEAAQQEQAD